MIHDVEIKNEVIKDGVYTGDIIYAYTTEYDMTVHIEVTKDTEGKYTITSASSELAHVTHSSDFISIETYKDGYEFDVLLDKGVLITYMLDYNEEGGTPSDIQVVTVLISKL